MGRARLPQPRVLQRTQEGRSLCRLGTTGTLCGRDASGVQVAALTGAASVVRAIAPPNVRKKFKRVSNAVVTPVCRGGTVITPARAVNRLPRICGDQPYVLLPLDIL